MVQLDLTEIGYPEASFDVIVCAHVLEHIPSDVKAMKEMFRVLSPGGLVVVQVPLYGQTTYEDFSITSERGRLAAFGQRDHVRKYGLDLQNRLAGAGFHVRPIGPPADERQCWRFGLRKTPGLRLSQADHRYPDVKCGPAPGVLTGDLHGRSVVVLLVLTRPWCGVCRWASPPPLE